MASRRYVILFGAQGSGKGTQARLLQEKLGIPQVATGDLFRYNLKNNTELGQLAKGYMDRGELVPDEVTNAMVRERLSREDAADGAILDGYPRNLNQARALDEMLAEWGAEVTRAIYIDVSMDELMRRLTGRRVCRSCQATYHVVFKPPRQEGVCDVCGGELYQRDDDKDEAAIRRRLEIYQQETLPVIEYYRERGLLSEVSGEQPIEAVNADILKAIGVPADDVHEATAE
ncbi:adenylate kinase [Ardenticatena maritima]|uniref:Adenylate kinase n=1 Tax=Ardenticatena maritima TaxID=872965 RepID=A0A0M9UBL4_9CHLR|nr:adenylate kinase [Ardenticatena maritima]KPL90045.1 adenylate kinase [Ardenticatena maritima]GAP61890.1 adenylate kinase [Ardenticatena maritima]